mmetsp:Transcript_9653/g.20266  ORF Transcript_9653/g.20266 Transcript_9653/m.20266 type:complete len:268 (-) Transcript_9653:150-953(-)
MAMARIKELRTGRPHALSVATHGRRGYITPPFILKCVSGHGPQASCSNENLVTLNLQRHVRKRCTQFPIKEDKRAPSFAVHRLVVTAIDFALRVKDATPVLLLELGLGIHVDQSLHIATLLAQLEGLHVLRGGDAANDQLANRVRAPRASLLAGFDVELGAGDRLHDNVALDLCEGGRLTCGGHLVREAVNAALGIAHDGNFNAVLEARVDGVGLDLRSRDHVDPHILGGNRGRPVDHADGRRPGRRERGGAHAKGAGQRRGEQEDG